MMVSTIGFFEPSGNSLHDVFDPKATVSTSSDWGSKVQFAHFLQYSKKRDADIENGCNGL